MGRLYVPEEENLRQEIMRKAHKGPFSLHKGSVMMYRDLRSLFWWPWMKREISKFVMKESRLNIRFPLVNKVNSFCGHTNELLLISQQLLGLKIDIIRVEEIASITIRRVVGVVLQWMIGLNPTIKRVSVWESHWTS
ncbi:DNA/RNA polymerase superfamily protein [Gossypium australe]|uniref:DNA/RNA polymerase superfamily protein n=1 Tax=Gossypium australe TaxID=47621 RepID=A0A5B6VLP7_9ROSI|nr:DNA/RNA polymerase superfamily protein [Gossypium australe]